MVGKPQRGELSLEEITLLYEADIGVPSTEVMFYLVCVYRSILQSWLGPKHVRQSVTILALHILTKLVLVAGGFWRRCLHLIMALHLNTCAFYQPYQQHRSYAMTMSLLQSFKVTM